MLGRSMKLEIAALARAYDEGTLTPSEVAATIAARAEDPAGEGIWICREPTDRLVAAARELERRAPERAALPLYGIPFAVQDNIDVAGVPTTAACPALAYTPERSAPVVERLLRAGALFVGKTNMDQLATGLVGVRSPFGIPRNPFDARYPVGGSSAGSAAAVARGLCSFALGTDTAGSGRVPAALTGIVGLKPSRGLLSTRGVVPACRSLDCVSVFAQGCADAAAVAEVARGYDPEDPASRPVADTLSWAAGAAAPATFRFGVPEDRELEFFGDGEAARLFGKAVARLESMGGKRVTVPFAPLREAAGLLYDGPWVAERLAPFEELLEKNPQALLPVIREILGAGRRYRGTDVFRARHRLEELQQVMRGFWRDVDLIFLPTTPTVYTIAVIQADPIRLNARLGIYTNFANLLDMCGVAVPGRKRADGLPSGVSLLGPRESDPLLAALGARFHSGASVLPLTRANAAEIELAVVGAHLSGQPLNHQLTDLGARLVRATTTAPVYRLFALAETSPPKPGLVRVSEGGAAIEIEVWALPRGAFGSFFANVRPPLCIGTIETAEGAPVAGFLCESHAVSGAADITSFGGWRAYRNSRG